MKHRIIEYLKKLSYEVFYTIINPALVMGLGFLFISGSVTLEKIAKWTGIELLTLNGILGYDLSLQVSMLFHGYLNEYNLIPILFFSGMGVFIFQRYMQLGKTECGLQRLNKAVSLAIFESLFLACTQFVGVIRDIQAIFPDAISNSTLVLVITMISLAFSIPGLNVRYRLAKACCNFLSTRATR